VDVSLEIEGYSPDATSERPQPVEAALERIRTGGVQSQIERLREAKRTRPAADFAGVVHGGDLVVRALIATNRVADAVTLSGALAELFPTETRAAAVHGLALAISGDASGAAGEYERMKQVFRPPVVDPNERFPQVDETWYWLDELARSTIEWGHAARGVALARTIAGLYPGTARAHTTLGVLLAETGDGKGAEAAYARALEVDPRETRALEWRRRLHRPPGATQDAGDSAVAITELFLANGVTTVVNMRGTPQILELRSAVTNGQTLGPRIYTTGPFVTEPFVKTPEAVERAVVEQKRAGYDFVKLHGSLS